jgi:heme exporter protein A
MTTPTLAAPAVRASRLARRYGRRWALVDVSFEVPAGLLVMLTGANGSGKSTLLRVLATSLRPDAGEVTVLGHDVRGEKDAVRRRTALLSHQTFLYEALSAEENLHIASRFLGRPAADVRPRLAEVGLAERAHDPVGTFSAGMRRRLAFARCLLQEPEVALLDEPYAQLDAAGVRLVDEVVARLRARGATVIMATHQLEKGAAQADLALELRAGRVGFCGPAAELPRADRVA